MRPIKLTKLNYCPRSQRQEKTAQVTTGTQDFYLQVTRSPEQNLSRRKGNRAAGRFRDWGRHESTCSDQAEPHDYCQELCTLKTKQLGGSHGQAPFSSGQFSFMKRQEACPKSKRSQRVKKKKKKNLLNRLLAV